MVDHRLTSFLVIFVFFGAAKAADNDGCPRIFTRRMWAAKNPRDPNLVRPLVNASVIVVHHTNTFECFTHGPCQNQMRTMQREQIFESGYNDIAYNFVVTASGAVYEGRGWETRGENSSAPGLIDRAMNIAFHGTFEVQLPRDKAFASFKALIECGQRMKMFEPNTKLGYVAHRQLKSTTGCPGTALYKYMLTSPDFDPIFIKPNGATQYQNE